MWNKKIVLIIKNLSENISFEEFKLNLVDLIYKKALDNNSLCNLFFNGDKEKLIQETNNKFIQIPEGINFIKSDLSFFYREVYSLILPKGLTSIPLGRFIGLKNLKWILIPDGVERIESKAFADCIKLSIIKIPKSVTFIERDAFWKCENLSAINFLDSVNNNENFSNIFSYLFI